MVFASRDRFRIDNYYEGTWTPDNRYIPPYIDKVRGSWSRCRDNPGLGPNQGFLVEKLECEGGYISGDLHGNGFNVATGRCTTQRWPHVNASQIVAGVPQKPNPVMAAEVLSRTNPSKPYVNIPLSIVELRDLPDTVRNYGRTFFQTGGADAYLAYKFGLAPIVGDAVKLMQFPKAVTRRMKALKSLQSRGFTCQKVQLDNSSDTGPQTFVGLDNRPIGSSYGYETSSWKQRVWGYANWHAQDFDEVVGDDKLMERAISSLKGYDSILNLSNLWELLPWSWLLDYFGNVGDILSANQNTVGAVNDGMAYICVHTTCRMDGFCSTHPQFITPFHSTFESKSRTPVPATLSAQIPYLNEGQMGILAAIGATRR